MCAERTIEPVPQQKRVRVLPVGERMPQVELFRCERFISCVVGVRTFDSDRGQRPRDKHHCFPFWDPTKSNISSDCVYSSFLYHLQSGLGHADVHRVDSVVGLKLIRHSFTNHITNLIPLTNNMFSPSTHIYYYLLFLLFIDVMGFVAHTHALELNSSTVPIVFASLMQSITRAPERIHINSNSYTSPLTID